jgi:hypothetical protein
MARQKATPETKRTTRVPLLFSQPEFAQLTNLAPEGVPLAKYIRNKILNPESDPNKDISVHLGQIEVKVSKAQALQIIKEISNQL